MQELATPTVQTVLVVAQGGYSPLMDPLLWAAVAAFLNASAGLFLAIRAHIRDQATRRNGENNHRAAP